MSVVAIELDLDFDHTQQALPVPANDWRERAIIVCDPTAFSRRLTVDILRYAGADRIQTCATPDAALWFAENTKDPLMLIDWRDERLDAAQTVRKLRRAKPRLKKTPVMILSSRNSLLDVEQARDAGVDSFALRPISPKVLTERLAFITQSQRPFVNTPGYSGPDRRVRQDRHPSFKRDQDVAAGLTRPLNAAKAQAHAIIFSMLRRGDELAARVGRSMERYLGTVDHYGSREREVVDLHRASLGRLEDLRLAPVEMRQEVVTGLEQLVQRRVRG